MSVVDRARTSHPSGRARRNLAAALVLLAVACTACGTDSDSGDELQRPGAGSVGSAVETTTSTTGDPAEPGSTSSIPALPGSIVWPADPSTSSDDPREAATRFAEDFVGFVDPVVSEAEVGTDGWATVEVRPGDTGPVTTLRLVRHGEGTPWFVTGASTPNIVVDPELSGSTLVSPARIKGTSTAFEGTVDVTVRARGGDGSLGSGFVTGGANGAIGPFDGTVEFSRGQVTDGVLILSTTNLEDGSLWEATVIPVVLG